MKSKCNLEFYFSSASSAKAACDALKQEEDFKKRVDSKVEVKGITLLLSVIADDTTSMRATLNSYLRSLQVIEGINTGAVGNKNTNDDVNKD